MVQSARRFGRLVTAVVVAYWFTVLVGRRALPRGYARQVLSWGTASVFFLAREFLACPPPDAPHRLDRLLDWVARVLRPSRVLPSWHPHTRRLRPRLTP